MQRKILTIFILIVILIYVFTTNSYAYTQFSFSFKDLDLNYEYSDLTYDYLGIEPNYLTFIRNSYGRFFIISEEPCYIKANSIAGYDLIAPNNHYRFEYDMGSDKWKGPSIFTSGNFSSNMERYAKESFQSGVYYCNYDIMYNGEVFRESDEKSDESLLLMTINSINSFDSVTSEIISILPVTLIVVISLVSIRKGISFIVKELCNA